MGLLSFMGGGALRVFISVNDSRGLVGFVGLLSKLGRYCAECAAVRSLFCSKIFEENFTLTRPL